ncbi:hypothetical protein ACIQVO_22840 [Streptomyces sp. NPDC101062]|uniref:hypothetical protein n=1 Tax=unclassified Streptomyces TaxID=2593676 RepID=UPI0038027E5B
MSGDAKDLDAPDEALALIAEGIDKAHGELKDLGAIGQATAGRGFSELALTGLELGHQGLTAQFDAFCERWEWGVRALMWRGNNFASGVGLSAGAFHEQEQYVKGTFKIAVNAVNGNPHLSEEEVQGKSWDEIRSQSATDGADYSAESFAEAHGEVKQNWGDTMYVAERAALKDLQETGIVDPELNDPGEQKLRDTFSPSEAAVQQADERYGPSGGSDSGPDSGSDSGSEHGAAGR